MKENTNIDLQNEPNKKEAIPQSTRFFIQLYDEPTLDKIASLGVKEYAFIKHDLDLWTEEDEEENPEHKAGTYKKLHWHLYVHTFDRRTINSIAKQLKIESRFVRFAQSEIGCLRYLTHIDQIEKYQYCISQITSNIDLKIAYQLQISDSDFIINVINLISTGEIFTFHDLTLYALNNGKLDLFMKRSYFFNTLLKERG